MRIGIAYDLAPGTPPSDGPDDLYEEFDKPETIDALGRVLEARGHVVERLGNGRGFLERVLGTPPDLVWNLAEGQGAGRCREARVPAVCEMLDIPCTGSDPLTLAVALDKPLAKRLVADVVAVPPGCLIEPCDTADAAAERIERLATRSRFTTRWIAKPAFEGSSKGIRAASVLDSARDAGILAVRLARDYHQPILVESYIAGDEVTVGLVGHGDTAEILGMMRIRPRESTEEFVYSIESKREWNARIVYETPARLEPAVSARLGQAALGAYRALGCRDVARIDFRIDDGVPYFLEANPLPGLAPDWSDLVILSKGVGIDYDALIGRILEAACARLGLPGGARE